MANSSLDLANLAKKGASNQLVWVFQVLGEEICSWPTGIGLCRKRPTANCQSSQVGVAINSDLVGFFRWVRSVGELDNPSPNYWIIKNNKNKRKCLEFFLIYFITQKKSIRYDSNICITIITFSFKRTCEYINQ